MVDWPKILGGVLVLAAITWVVLEIREAGARSGRTAIERQNNEAANRAHSKRTDYDTCLAAGGLWNFGAGERDGLRSIVGTDLIGAVGATPADQRKIDRTVVGICAAAVWTKGECARHGEGR